MVVDIASNGEFRGGPRNLTANWDLEPSAPDWAGSNSSVRFAAYTGGNLHLFEADGGRVHQVTEGDRHLRAFTFSKSGGRMAYTVDSEMAPPEVAIASRDGGGEMRVTSFNDEWLKGITLATPERITYTVADGTEIEGWVVPPIAQESGKQYPMVLKIHGGPHASYGNTWFPTFHILSAAGMYVLYTNPRGSAGYGHDFMLATRGKWGLLDSEDYLKGVDTALAKYTAIDPERIGVSGGSYGGFMTAWLSATTNRFAAANPSRMIANWESWFGASDAQALTEFEFFDFPWKERDLYRKLSPLSYVENVNIPTLIIEGEEDYRTPMAEGEQWFMALKKRNVPVELVRYPRSSHGLSRTGEPWLLVDRVERIKSWFVHWLVEEKVTRPKD
jgi:dipeptidyl aminopeptidase/acylaminoacyl peptidase